MISVKYTFNDRDELTKQSECRGGDFAGESVYVKSKAISEFTVENGKVREIIRGSEGIFKDVINDIGDITKVIRGDKFFYLISKGYIYSVKRDSFTEGSEEELLKLFSNRKKPTNTPLDKKIEKSVVDRDSDYWKQIRKENNVVREQSFGDKFRIPLTVSAVLFIFALINMLDPFQNHFGGFEFSIFSVIGLVGSAIMGFVIGCCYIFFKVWFDNQKESTKILSIVLFPVTFLLFAPVAILGFIPYIIFVAIKGNDYQLFYKVIRIGMKVSAVMYALLLIIAVVRPIFFT